MQLDIGKDGHKGWQQQPDGQHGYQNYQKSFLQFCLLSLIVEVHCTRLRSSLSNILLLRASLHRRRLLLWLLGAIFSGVRHLLQIRPAGWLPFLRW